MEEVRRALLGDDEGANLMAGGVWTTQHDLAARGGIQGEAPGPQVRSGLNLPPSILPLPPPPLGANFAKRPPPVPSRPIKPCLCAMQPGDQGDGGQEEGNGGAGRPRPHAGDRKGVREGGIDGDRGGGRGANQLNNNNNNSGSTRNNNSSSWSSGKQQLGDPAVPKGTHIGHRAQQSFCQSRATGLPVCSLSTKQLAKTNVLRNMWDEKTAEGKMRAGS
ncbi:unnamed protein product [Pleuronectes platessa]|uniref:Uncharacterized protein n=1 Tax=Pleuronectes platessa TaxID=8262 RepID=A0A9N7YRV1_PLEPL|nr:unnamed protein product [Pleuronectes platessa]